MYKNVSQLIEKERSRNPLHHFWTTTAAKNYTQENDGTAEFYNQFEETENNGVLFGKSKTSVDRSFGPDYVENSQESVIVHKADTTKGGVKTKFTEGNLELESLPVTTDCVENSLKSDPDLSDISSKTNPDADSESIDQLKEFSDTEETDYFDSEDEYWETRASEKNQKQDMGINLNPSTNSPKGGRYSKFINLPIFKQSIHDFAADNSLEVHDVIADGDCLFNAIADQLLINGCPGHTKESLRQIATQHLRKKSREDDGTHLSSFLFGETWEEYLSRMERPGQWGDHITLQTLADVFTLKIIVFNVYQDDIRRTEVEAESNEDIKTRLTIYLGHLGEFHYLSLRPKHWQIHWPYKAVLYRLLACSKDLNPEDSFALLKDRLSSMSSGKCISKSVLDETSEHISGIMHRRNEKNTQAGKKNHDEIFTVNSGGGLQLEDTEDSLQLLIEDLLHTDPISGTPLPHLTFLLKHLIPITMLCNEFGQLPPHTRGMFQFLGSFADGSNYILTDISKAQKMRDFYIKQMREKVAKVVVLKSNIPVLSSEAPPLPYALHFDTSNTKAGYCRLKFPPERAVLAGEKTFKIESETYLQAFSIEGYDSSFLNADISAKVKYIGLICPLSLVALDWLHSRRKFDFPSRLLLILFHDMPCTLIPKAHKNSENPLVEWKIDFSKIEMLLFDSLTDSQRHGFAVIKVLLDNITFHVEKKLQTKHIKSIFFQACEDIPSNFWNVNFSGCVLFVLSKLVICLKHRFLPHYFIPQSNLIDCFSVEEIDTICVYVESIRAFPAHTAQFVAENHGFTYGPNLVKSLLNDIACFVQNRNVAAVVEHTVVPCTYRTAKFLAKLGFYVPTCELLKEMHIQTQLITEYRLQNSLNLQDFFRNALHKMKQRSSRVILAKLFDARFGTNMANLFFKEKDFSLAKILPWVVDFKINWLEVPREKTGDLSTVAEFLLEYSFKEYEKRNKTLSTCTIEAAIRCLRHTIQEDSIDMKEIEDEDLKQEILSQKRELKAVLKLYYTQVFIVSRLRRDLCPLRKHMPDIEKLFQEFPEMGLIVSDMFAYLGMYNKSEEYATKFASHFPGLLRPSEYHVTLLSMDCMLARTFHEIECKQ
ncbi:uncharacterized protein LOC134239939 [Saccostrea cucullata]|uniref:uncharacterized protein LOC134239939 n=1 Tax=Saccostrea cuccullata TaxID=36930 RepID=UPI002ED242A5